jgi:hypothetical protein
VPRERLARAMEDECATVFRDDANVNPALSLNQLRPTDVVKIYASLTLSVT